MFRVDKLKFREYDPWSTVRSKFEVQDVKVLHDGFLRLEEATVKYEVEGGELSDSHARLTLRAGHAVGVLVFHRPSKTVVLVRQFRYATSLFGKPFLLEIPAGRVDEGETFEEAAIRELKEEIGFEPDSIQPLGSFFPSCGILAEQLHLFFAEVDETHRAGAGGGVGDEAVQIVYLRPDQVIRMIEDGELLDAKAQIAILRAHQKHLL